MEGAAGRRFTLAYAPGNARAFALFGLGPTRSGVELDADALRVRMGWAFRAELPLARVAGVEVGLDPPWIGWGVHGWRGRWLVNGTMRGLVCVRMEEAAAARVLGLSVRVLELWLSMEEPHPFARAVAASSNGSSVPSVTGVHRNPA